MPAALPQSAGIKNDPVNTYPANPSAGQAVLMDALSGPKGSPLDKDNTGNCSTGALSTCIGFGSNVIVGSGLLYGTPPTGVNGGFTDDTGEGASGVNSTFVYLGGGRSVTASGVNTAGVAGTSPYTAGFFPVGAGNGGSRDGGAGPAFTGFTHKMVTATAGTANGVAIEAGFINRTGVALTTGQSAFGSSTAAQAAAS
jgi:hypothetical protein